MHLNYLTTHCAVTCSLKNTGMGFKNRVLDGCDVRLPGFVILFEACFVISLQFISLNLSFLSMTRG